MLPTQDANSSQFAQSFQRLLQVLPNLDMSKPGLTQALYAIVNELVQWKSLQEGKGVDVKVKELPLRMVITRVEGKLNLVVYTTGELKQQLNEHHKELVALLKKKNIDLFGLNVLELEEYAQHAEFVGRRPFDKQGRGAEARKQVAQFGTLLKGASNDIADF